MNRKKMYVGNAIFDNVE